MIQYKNQHEAKVGDQVVFFLEGELLAGHVIEVREPSFILVKIITGTIIAVRSFDAMRGDDALKFQPDM